MQLARLWDPWEISEGGLPKKGTQSEKLRFILNYVVLAPSSHNSQPWLFKITESGVELYADRTRALPVTDPEDRELIISCGAALFHLRVALQHFAYSVRVESLPDSNNQDLLARVMIDAKNTKRAGREENLQFNSITKRRTNRMPFEDRKIPDTLLRELQASASKEGAWLHFASGEDNRNQVADLIAEGDRIQMANRHFRRELAAWVHPTHAVSHDGMPGYALGISSFASSFASLVVRTFDIGKGQAAKDRQLASGSPVLGLLGTDGDSLSDWLTAGQALARVLLHARGDGVWASFLNQPIEVPELRPRLRDLFGRKGYPQMLMRMGYGQDVRPTPRRTPGEVLLRGR
jgi:hypothetical protein